MPANDTQYQIRPSTELDRFIAAIEAAPDDALGRWALADWLEEHPEAIEPLNPREGELRRWVDNLRQWRPVGGVIFDLRVTPDTYPLYHTLVAGRTNFAAVEVLYEGLFAHQPCLPDHDVSAVRCVFQNCEKITARLLSADIVAERSISPHELHMPTAADPFTHPVTHSDSHRSRLRRMLSWLFKR
jgi:uncharacterized protein (TIGR02996 family)